MRKRRALSITYEFDLIAASRFPKSPEEEILPDRIWNAKDKAVIVKKRCDQQGCAMDHWVAFGDSMSDYLLFQELEHTVAVNADPTLKDLARYNDYGLDLYDAFVSVCRKLARARV